jgi:hypothetical protein
MATLTLRLVKGSPLTNAEIDDNFSNINTEVATKLDAVDYTASDVLTKLLTVDGSGTGLDADLLDGLNTASTNTVSTVVVRDSSGKFAANEITANKFVGNLELGSLKTLTFEGATDDAYETVLSVVDPTADRTIVFPDESGTVVLTGGSSSADSITTIMIEDGAVTNAKLEYSTISINGESVSLGSNINTADNNYVWTGTHEFSDINFTLKDNADNTKLVQFQVSAISTGTTRTLTIPDENATLATQDYVQRTGYNSQGVKTISTAAPSGGSNGDVWYRV